MPSQQELASGYVERLSLALNEEAEVRAIAVDINSLVYVSSRKPVSAQYKSQIVDLMAAEFPRPRARPDGLVGILKEADNKRYLLLVQSLRAMLAG